MLEMCLFLLQNWFILIHFHLVAKKSGRKRGMNGKYCVSLSPQMAYLYNNGLEKRK